MKFLKYSFAALFLCCPLFALGQDIAVEVLTKKIELARPLEIAVTLPAPAALDTETIPQDFEVIAARPDDKNILTTIYTLLPFTLGEIDFPPLTFVDENGQEIKTEAIKIEVKPTRTKIRAKGLVDIRQPRRPFNWPRLILFALAAGAVAYLIYWYRKKRAAPPAPAADPYKEGRPCNVVALEQIDNLLLTDLWQSGLFKIFYIKLSDIYRDYLTARFNIQAHKYTSRDLARALRRVPGFKGDIALAERFQKSADLVKFAKATPPEDMRDADINNLKTIINQTAPAAAMEEQNAKLR